MEPISQLDVQNPDHVSVITKDGRVTVSVVKDGSSVTLGFPIRNALDTTPRFPLQQPSPVVVKRQVQEAVVPQLKPMVGSRKNHVRYNGPTPKLNPASVREIKGMLNDEIFMAQFTSKTKAYQRIGKMFNVTGCAINNIARGIAWSHIKV
jgi:hypothetical protein